MVIMVIMPMYRLIIQKNKSMHIINLLTWFCFCIMMPSLVMVCFFLHFYFSFNFLDGKTGFMTRSMKRKAKQLAAKQRNNDQSPVARQHLIPRAVQNAHNQEITSQNHQGMNRARSGKPQGRREEEKDKRNCKSNFYDTCVKSVFDKHEVYNNATFPVFIN